MELVMRECVSFVCGSIHEDICDSEDKAAYILNLRTIWK